MKRRNFIKLLTSALAVPAIAKAEVSIPESVIEQLPESSDIETVGRIVLPEKKIYTGGVIDLGAVYSCVGWRNRERYFYNEVSEDDSGIIASQEKSRLIHGIDVTVAFSDVLYGLLQTEFNSITATSVYSLSNRGHKFIASAQCVRLQVCRTVYGQPAIDIGLICDEQPAVISPEIT